MQIENSKFSYRKVRKDEASMLVDYRMQFLEELQGPQDPDRILCLKEDLKEYFQSSLAAGSFIAWMAELNQIPIAFGGMVIQKIPGHFNLINGIQGYILNMYTVPEYRKNGIGAEILEKLIDDGKKLGLNKIYLHSTRAGIEIYKRKGFKEPEFPELEYLDL